VPTNQAPTAPLNYALYVSELADLLESMAVAAVAVTTRALAEAQPDFDLTFPQWRVLVILGQSSDGATVSQVATRVGVTVPATSRQLRRLAHRGLIEISRDQRDRRATRARLTVEGVAVLNAILEYRRDRLAQTAAEFEISDASLADLSRIVQALARYQ